MMKRDGAAVALPIQQTVFLPKEAMGVRYIDKIRAKVFVESVNPAEDGAWLRGFYELDLEYQGVEGRGLCKQRVMLPLKVLLPPGWPAGLQFGDYDAQDLHAAIKKPMIKLLSPYVLEFSADLALEYLGNHCWQEDKANAAPEQTPSKPRRVWRSDLPMPDANRPEARIESKIDRFFLGKAAAVKDNEAPHIISSRGILPDESAPEQTVRKAAAEVQPQPVAEAITEAAAEAEHSLPVWQFIPKEPTVKSAAYVEKPAENPVEKRVENPVDMPVDKSVENFAEKRAVEAGATMDMEQIYAPPLNKNRFRSLLTAAALSRLQARGEALADESGMEAALAEAEAMARQEQNTGENTGENIKEAAKVAEVTETEVQNIAEVTEPTEAAEVAEPVEVAEVTAAEADVEAAEVTEAAAEEVMAEVAEVTAEATEATEAAEAAAEAEPQAQAAGAGLQMVNNGGVKVRVAAVGNNAGGVQNMRPASGGFSIKYYVVKPGEDPMSIALKHNISLERLREANRLPEGELAAGTLLRIPR